MEGFESKEDLVACLKASANVPRIAGEPLQHRYHDAEKNRLHLSALVTTINKLVVAWVLVLSWYCCVCITWVMMPSSHVAAVMAVNGEHTVQAAFKDGFCLKLA